MLRSETQIYRDLPSWPFPAIHSFCNMTITLNHHPLSPAVGGVLLTIKALGLEDQVIKKEADLSAVRLSPAHAAHAHPPHCATPSTRNRNFLSQGLSLHTVPSIEEDGFVLWNR